MVRMLEIYKYNTLEILLLNGLVFASLTATQLISIMTGVIKNKNR
jgi:hypothetical protein